MEYTFLSKEVKDLVENTLPSQIYSTNKLDIDNKIDSLLVTIKTSYEDKKLSIEEITELIKEISTITYEIVKISNNLDEDKFVQLVLDIVTKIYFSENGLNNPDLTFLPNIVENKIENIILKDIIPRITKEIYHKLK